MAINKKQSSVWVKVVLVVVVVAFVGSLAPGLFLGRGAAPQATDVTDTAATLERIANDHIPAVTSYTAQLQNDPEDYNALVQLGNVYFDWAFQIQANLGSTTGHDLPMWNAAISAYERALAVQPGDPNVEVDLAISYFYAGQVDSAVDRVEQTKETTPDFGPAYFNAAIFYRALGRTDDAVAALERYLEVEPEGQSAPAARDMLAQMQAAPSAETTTQP